MVVLLEFGNVWVQSRRGGGGASDNGNMLLSSFHLGLFRHGSPASGPTAIALNTHPDALDDLENSCEEKRDGA